MKKVCFLSLCLIALSFAYSGCSGDDDVKITNLPDAVQAYLNTNYPDAEIEEAGADTLCDGTSVYEVEIEIGDDEEMELVFDIENNFLYSETEIKFSALPAAVTASIDTNYSGYTPDDEADRLDMADGSTRYEAELIGNQQKLDVLFAADGSVICEEVDED